MSKNSTKYISVFVPTYNGEDFLAELIEAVLTQQLPTGYKLDFLIIDSGSSDKTLEILDAYKSHLTIEQIPNTEFSHGGTRDKAARMAKGDFLLLLSQDATPMHERWLINMIEPFFISDRVGCVFGRQIPRRNVSATIKREVVTAFGSLGAPESIVFHRPDSLVDGKPINTLNTFFSDANSAARRKLLVGEVPFRQVAYAEDQALAEDMQKAGYLKVYAPQGEVWHSNMYTARQYFKRKFDEFTGLQESLGKTFTPSRRSLLLGWIRPTFMDWKFIYSDADYRLQSKIKWAVLAPAYNIANSAGLYYGAKHINDMSKRSKISLEADKKK